MKLRCEIVITLLVFVGFGACAQSNEVIDTLLAQDEAAFGPTLQLVLSAGDRVDDGASEDAALDTLQSLGWRLSEKALSEPITAKELSYLILKSLDMSGGIMYLLIPSPRYAFRELVYRGVMSRQMPPNDVLSGEQVVRYLGAVLRMSGGAS